GEDESGSALGHGVSEHNRRPPLRTTTATFPKSLITGGSVPPTAPGLRMVPDTLAIGWYKPLSGHGKMTMSPVLACARNAARRGDVVKRVGPAVGIVLLTAAPCFAQSPAAPSSQRQSSPQAFIADNCIGCHNSTDQS